MKSSLLSLNKAKRLTRKLNRKPPLMEIFARSFTKLKML
jgi:hypothetical protein